MKLDIYVVAKELAVLVSEANIRDVELRDQATRAAKSAFLNLCEGLPSRSPAMRRKFFASAQGSIAEVAAALYLASALGAVDSAHAQAAMTLALRFRSMLRAL